MVALHGVEPRRRIAGTLAALTLLAAFAPLAPPVAQAGSTQIVNGLFQSLAYTSAARDGGSIFVFGGCSGPGCMSQSPNVFRYDPSVNQVFTGGNLPSGRSGTATSFALGYFYVFGGFNGATLIGDIVQFHWTGMSQLLPVVLPSPRHGMAAFSDGYFIYLVGGCLDSFCDIQSNQILRFDPSAQTIMTMATLPYALGRTTAVWDGQQAYFFGGRSGTGATADVFRWTPGMASAQPLTTLPGPRHSASAAILNGKAFVYGGNGPGGAQQQIVQYDLVTLQGSIPTEILPLALSGTSAVAFGSAAYVFGGCTDGACGSQSRDIVQHRSNSPPVAYILPVQPQPCMGGGASVTLDGSSSYDPDNDPLQHSWSGYTSVGTSLPFGSGLAYTHFFPPGDSYVQLQVSDGEFVSSWGTGVYVYDDAPPAITGVRPSPGNLYIMDNEIPHGVTGFGAELGPLSIGAEAIPVAIGPLTLRVEADDTCAMQGVHFFVSNGLASFDATPPYEMVLEPPAGTVENLTVQVWAVDGGNWIVTSEIRVYHVGADTQPAKDACLLVFSPTVCALIP